MEEEDDVALDLIEDDADPNVGFDSDDEQPKPIYKLEDAPKLFKQFIKDYDKKYKNEEDKSEHYKTFVNTLKEINMINSNKEYSSTVDINLFADLSTEERQQYSGVAALLGR
ncbi:unnamed protein product [Arctia plantaginis]|uniref:Cathepsin propeptide inhibitor domain-containing protein n=1 Tax=Arctia plantaginis TaxID=874455 RepID=A0A8S0YWE2_ARCPL|nr:unnamed protein product [Arctia plantaginis]